MARADSNLLRRVERVAVSAGAAVLVLILERFVLRSVRKAQNGEHSR